MCKAGLSTLYRFIDTRHDSYFSDLIGLHSGRLIGRCRFLERFENPQSMSVQSIGPEQRRL